MSESIANNIKARPDGQAFILVEHLEKSSPLIIGEVARWWDLLWDGYLDYKYRENRSTDAHKL